MPIIHFSSRLISAWFAFILPGFRTFQALQHRPFSEQDVERWSKYWVVIGFVVALEYTVEWLFSWFPFYWEVRTLFLLFLSLPQVQGSTFVYDSYITPFLVRNEAEFDQQIALAKTNLFGFFASRISFVLDRFMKVMGFSQTSDQATGQPIQNANGSAAMQTAMNFWNTYGAPYLNSFSGGQSSSVQSAAHPSPSPLGSSTAIQSSASSPSTHLRNGFVPEAQVPLPATPEDIHRAHQTPDTESLSTPPPFPVPQHFE